MSRRLLPFIFVLWIFNYLDRTNVGLAALQMNQELGFSSRVFALGASIFFVGYALFEIPSNLIFLRVGARRWIARIMISWGLIASAMLLVRTPAQFYTLRFLLGVAEAGFGPAVIYYLSQWFPASMRARSTARVLIALPLATAVGGPLGGWLLGFNDRAGLAGWQWLFLVEGIPSIVLGFVVLYYLTDLPSQATWLSAEQREWLVDRLRRERDEGAAHATLPALRALTNPLIWLVALPLMLISTVGYAYLFWAPVYIRDALHTTDQMTGLITGFVACLCVVALLLSGASSDRSGERCLHAASCAAIAALGCFGAAVLNDPVLKVASLSLMQIGVASFLAPFLCLPTMLFSGASAAIGIALVNAIGNTGGFLGPLVVGFLRTTGGGDGGAFVYLGVLALAAAIICVLLRQSPLLARQVPARA